MRTSAPAPVIDLSERFSRDRKVFLSGEYKEEQLHAESHKRTIAAADSLKRTHAAVKLPRMRRRERMSE